MPAAHPSRARYVVAGVAAATVVAVAIWMLVRIGCSHQVVFAWDSMMFLDWGWRIWTGQRPHVDFYSPMGSLPLFTVAAGMWISGLDARALTAGFSLVGGITAVFGWVLCARRFSPWVGAVLTATLALLVLSTVSIGVGLRYDEPSYAMQHNRVGWALTALLLIHVLVPPRGSPSRATSRLEGVVSGLVFGGLLATKMNYALAAVGTYGVACFVEPHVRRSLPTHVATVGLLFLGYAAFLRFDLAPFFGDLRTLFGAQDSWLWFKVLLGNARDVWAELLAMGLLVVALATTVRAGPADAPSRRRFVVRLVVLAALSGALGVFVLAGNSQHRVVPLLPVAGLCLNERARRRAASDADPSAAPRAPLATVVGVAFLGWVAWLGAFDAAAVVNSYRWHEEHASHRVAAWYPSASRVSAMAFPPGPGQASDVDAARRKLASGGVYWTGLEWVVALNDALEVLGKEVRPTDRVEVLDWFNPFPFILGSESPRGVPLFWELGRGMREDRSPSPDQFLHDVTLVLVPRFRPHGGTGRWMVKTYGPWVERHFREAGRSDVWVLYRRP